MDVSCSVRQARGDAVGRQCAYRTLFEDVDANRPDKKAIKGTATLANLTAGGATQSGKGGFSDDGMGLAGASATVNGPGALTRGGSWLEGTFAGVFKIDAGFNPSQAFEFIGFRRAR